MNILSTVKNIGPVISEKDADKINKVLHKIVEKHGLIEMLSQVSVVCAQYAVFYKQDKAKPLFVALDKFIGELKKLHKAA